ncbi:MFS general substrate transporter [Lentinus tigrinus ALCF2SS1-6]|uniref:MFS general substrate transporter n=1 Tax=Lentinus tigrinus ALCF2SS1-6 TaxID=1328759 RepID=A0A5C2SJ47_9APHY|nr:MFS general substrate transporter [Lentinus tigrinus ALCF2SS1-6]
MAFSDIYRHPFFSCIIVAWGAFCLPGAFGALNGMGAAGQVDATVSNAANAIVFGVLAVGAFVAGPLVNYLGVKTSFIIGTIGYSPYAASFYVNLHTGNNWFVIFGSVLLGLSAFMLWTASSAIFLGYPQEHHKGKAISMKFYFQHIGGSLGGIISLALNAKGNTRGHVSDATYYAFITIMCLALPAAFFVSPPEKVRRTDGTPVKIQPFASWKQEARSWWACLSDKRILILLPYLFYYQFDLSYMWGFNAAYHSVRARALMSFLFYLVGPAIGGALTGLFFDAKRWTRRQKARVAAIFLVVYSLGVWFFGVGVEYAYDKRPADDVIDWTQPVFGKSLVLFILYGLLENSNVLLIYYLIGSFTSDVNRLTSYAGLVNGIGSVGTVIAFVLGAVDVQLKGQLWANVACFLAAVPGLLYVAWNVTNPGEDEGAPSGTLTPQSVTYEEKETELRGVEVPPLTA